MENESTVNQECFKKFFMVVAFLSAKSDSASSMGFYCVRNNHTKQINDCYEYNPTSSRPVPAWLQRFENQ